MANYKEMYVQLFKETTKAIELLQKAQQQCEEIYLKEEDDSRIIQLKENK